MKDLECDASNLEFVSNGEPLKSFLKDLSPEFQNPTSNLLFDTS